MGFLGRWRIYQSRFKQMKTLISVSLALLLVGCATSFQNTGAKVLTSTALTVDASMKGWAAYVVAGGSTPAEEQNVKTAYGQYQIAMMVAQRSYVAAVNSGDQTGWTSAKLTLTSSSANLTTLIQRFQTQPKGALP